MGFFYYCLGPVAKLNSILARQRVNFIPINALLILGLAIYGAILWSNALDATHNSQDPLDVSHEQIRTGQGISQDFVRVSGLAIPAVVYRYEDGSVTKWWFPLTDPGNQRALLVERSGDIHLGKPRQETVTGMLRRLHAEVRIRLNARQNQFQGLPVETQYQLVEGDQPGDPRRSVAIAVLVSLLWACFFMVSLLRNTVFQGGGDFATPLAGIPAQPIPLRATGRFAFDAKTVRRFIDVPAILSIDRGAATLMSRIDASERFMGVKTAERKGIWSISVRPGTVQDGRFGFLYFGLSRHPAFRFSYVDARNGKPAKAVIAADESQHVVMAAASLTTA